MVELSQNKLGTPPVVSPAETRPVTKKKMPTPAPKRTIIVHKVEATRFGTRLTHKVEDVNHHSAPGRKYTPNHAINTSPVITVKSGIKTPTLAASTATIKREDLSPTYVKPKIDPNAALHIPTSLTKLKKKVKHKIHKSVPVKKDSSHKKKVNVISVEPGVNEIMRISRGHLNRIVTPFDQAVVKTVSNAKISTDGNIVYVTSNDDAPITMFISDKGDPETALSITLLPQPIPPRDVRVAPKGYHHRANKKATARWESTPFVHQMVESMTILANGEIPNGYVLRKANWKDLKIDCHTEIQGISLYPGQVVEGRQVSYLVLKATNVSLNSIEFDERECYQDGVLAVAAWPSTIIAPHQSVEVYIAIKNQETLARKRHKLRERPSLLGGEAQ